MVNKNLEGFRTPLLLVGYNRPEQTAAVLGVLEALRPRVLYAVVDGPKDSTEDQAKVAAVRDVILNKVTWECDLHLKFRETNLGCGKGMAGALEWFFSENPSGIVLEDDLVPDLTFFSFCEELLERFRDDSRVWGIGGDNSFGAETQDGASYGFTRYPLIWGWASWADRWELYDGQLTSWREDDVSWLHARERKYFSRILGRLVRDGHPDTWDYQLTATVFMENGLWVYPAQNLVTNIGFSDSATHTKNSSEPRANVASKALQNLQHPSFVSANVDLDKSIFKRVHRRPLFVRIFRRLRTIAGGKRGRRRAALR